MKDKSSPWLPLEPPLAVTLAIKGVAAGTANEDQQKRAMAWIIETLCGTYDLSYRPASDRDTVFAEGRRFVGLQLVKEIKINHSKLKETEHG